MAKKSTKLHEHNAPSNSLEVLATFKGCRVSGGLRTRYGHYMLIFECGWALTLSMTGGGSYWPDNPDVVTHEVEVLKATLKLAGL